VSQGQAVLATKVLTFAAMSHLRLPIVAASTLLCVPGIARPQDVADLPTDEEVEVSSRTPLSARDAPGVVTVIHRDEIEAAGVRDLLDLLHLVPGFAVGVDVESVVDVGFRGLWGHEGKVLFLLDGQELNETLFSTMQLGGRIPIDLVDRVEIVRGPGSAIYGGNAELAVIHVHTRRPRDARGVAGSASLGRMGEGFGHASAAASWSGSLGGATGPALSVNLAHAESVRSAATYRDFAGASFPMRRDSGIRDTLADLGLQAGGFRLRAIYDDYRLRSRDGVDAALPAGEEVRFESSFLDLRYDAKAAPGLTITPRLALKQHTPWQATADRSSALYYDKTASRLLGGLLVAWEVPRVNLVVGVEAFWDRARLNDPGQTPFGSSQSVAYQTAAAFAQALLRSDIANLHLGARYEHSSASGGAFVPRAGLTRIAGRFHFKLLYSQAFRSPAIENLNLNRDIRPERTNVAEAEVGLQLGGHVAATVNAYWTRIDRPIVFTVDPATGGDVYRNGPRTGTLGVESQLRVKYAWGFVHLGHSFYSAAGENRVDLYEVPGKSSLLLGFAAHKATLLAGLNLGRSATLGATAVALSKRYGYASGDGAGAPVLGAEPAVFLLGANLGFRDFIARGLHLSLGVQNLLDERYRILQPYNGAHPPLPAGGREVMVRLAFDEGSIRSP